MGDFTYITLFNFVTTLNSLIFPASQYFLIYSIQTLVTLCRILTALPSMGYNGDNRANDGLMFSLVFTVRSSRDFA